MNVLVKDHTRKVFEPYFEDHTVVEVLGKNQIVVKDNHGKEKKVHRRDVKAIDSDVKIAELYKEIRKEGSRDEKHCMPIKQIPDFGWEAPVTDTATSTGDPDSQSTKSPAVTKATKDPVLEPMPRGELHSDVVRGSRKRWTP